MIPAYNPPAKYLEQALRSVLQQEPGSERMQIEVVDDCSPNADVKKIVESVAGGRIAFSQTPKNSGLAGCWNACIERARGEWVHILHQDDYVLPGFYQRLEAAAAAHPEVSLLATRSFFVDEHSIIWRMTERLVKLENGGRAVEDFFYVTPIQCAGVAVRRSFYEAHGGFLPELKYTIDCEMWTRVISSSGGLVVPDVLACYRLFGAGETGRLSRNAEQLRDMARLNELYANRYPDFDRQKAAVYLGNFAMEKFQYFKQKGDMETAEAIKNYWRQNIPLKIRLRWSAKKIINSVV
jgi:glycosyltransferase involved in cell wall biosynthesis